jgi:hypothetical protein
MMDIKLAIALPAQEEKPDWGFVDSLVIMDKPYDWVYMRPTFPVSFPASLDDVRNNLVEQAFESDCTHILMLDTDQRYPRDTIARLFAHEKKIVRAQVHRRYPPFDPILLVSDDQGRYQHIPDEEWVRGGLIEVDATGVCACGLFDMEVFENVAHPWFETRNGPHGVVGEDVHFCEKAREAGYKIYVDCDLKVGHLAKFEIGEKFYNLYKAANGGGQVA